MIARTTLALAAAGLLAPAVVPTAGAAATVDVMSYNINWAAPSGKRLNSIAKVIASSGAEVAGLQQVRRFTRVAKKGNYGCVDQAARLASALSRYTGNKWYWAFAPNGSTRQSSKHCKSVTSHPRQEGVLVVSRYPITSASTHKLSYKRALGKAVISVPGEGKITVYTVHLDSFSASRRKVQARQVAALVKNGGGKATFLTGDMNSSPSTSAVETLRAVARDAWADKGSGSGATKRGRIDYVLYRGDARPTSARVIQTWVSDHRPVIARFRLD